MACGLPFCTSWTLVGLQLALMWLFETCTVLGESITKEVNEHVAGSLIQRIRRHLAVNKPFIGSNIKVVHEVRGVKNYSMHAFDRSVVTAKYAFYNWLCGLSLPLSIAKSKNWYVNVGVQVSSCEKASLVWRTEAHSALLQHLCKVTTLRAGRMTTPGSSLYRRDINSHLVHLSSCAIYPGDDGGPHGIVMNEMGRGIWTVGLG